MELIDLELKDKSKANPDKSCKDCKYDKEENNPWHLVCAFCIERSRLEPMNTK